MILEITTIEFLSLIGKANPDKTLVSYMDLYELACKIEEQARGVRVDVSERSFHKAINIHKLECCDKKIKTNSFNFKRILHTHSIPPEINSKLLQILNSK